MPFDLKILGMEAQFLDARLKLLKPILYQRWEERLVSSF